MPPKYSYAGGVSSPYYREEYGVWLKKTLDAMMENEDKDYRFSCQKARIRAPSLALKVNQAWAWIIDHQDPELKYYALRKRVKVATEDEFVTLRWKASGLNPKRCNDAFPIDRKHRHYSEPRVVNWRKKLVEFIEDASEGDYYEETSLDLDGHNQEFLKTVCLSAGDIAIVYVNRSGFKLIKHAMLAEKWREEQGLDGE